MHAVIERLDMTEDDLEALLERTRDRTISDEDFDKLEAVVGSFLHVARLLLGKDKVTLQRVRELLQQRASEKTRKVLEEAESTSANGTDAASSPSASRALSPAFSAQMDSAEKPKAKGHGRNGADAYKGASRVAVPHDELRSGARCPLCPKGRVYTKKQPNRLVRIVGQAPLHATIYELERLRCNLCGETFTAEPPEGVGDEKYDASAAAMLAVLKYGTGLPFHRLDRLQSSLAIPLPDSTQWDIVSDASRWLRPAFDELVRQGAQGEVLYNDDTFMRVLELIEQNKTLDPKKDRTGMFTSGIVATAEGRRIALFFTGRQHAGENLRDVLIKRAAERGPPVQMCDGLDRNVPKELEVILGNCLTHGRRHFVDVFPSFPEECRYVLEAIGEVYKNDAQARELELGPDERLALHQEQSAPVMTKLKSWIEAKLENKEVEPNSGLGRAMKYMLKRWQRLTLFLRQPGAPLDSNVVERSLKKAILNRKNSLFYKTANGALVGDILMSLIYTCEVNRVDPRHYLTALLQHRSELAEEPAAWMPWTYLTQLPDT